jgi:hypothetical protein
VQTFDSLPMFNSGLPAGSVLPLKKETFTKERDILRKRPSVGVLDQRRARAIRGLEIITKLAAGLEVEPADRRRWRQIEDGAVLQHGGVVAEIGPAADLIAKHPEVPVLGTERRCCCQALSTPITNIGLTPVQLGSPDIPLELWFVTRLVMRRVDLYLDTLCSAFEMIVSGITTVQHLHGWLPGDLTAIEAGAGEVIRAYEDIGMRVSYSFALRDQAPANLHWCSDAALELLANYWAPTRRRCICISSKPLIRRSTHVVAAAARHSTTSTASVSSGRF